LDLSGLGPILITVTSILDQKKGLDDKGRDNGLNRSKGSVPVGWSRLNLKPWLI